MISLESLPSPILLHGNASLAFRDPAALYHKGTLFLGQKDWPWAQGRLTAGFALDLRAEPAVNKILLFFHGSGPEDERTCFDTHASIGLAWSDDLKTWDWPRGI